MKRGRFRWSFMSPEAFEAVAYIGLWAAGLTGAGFALFLGKVYAAALIAVACFGAFLRLKRGRIKKD